MANTTYVLTFQTALPVSQYPVKDTTMPWEEIRAVRNFIQRVEAGSTAASFTAQTSTSAPVNASGTLTCAYASISNNDTVTIGKTVLTCVTGTPSGAQFKKEVDGPTTCANLVALIAANTTLNKYVTASTTTTGVGVVTITVLQPGVLGNQVALSSSATGFVASATYLASGAGGAETVAVTYHKGI